MFKILVTIFWTFKSVIELSPGTRSGPPFLLKKEIFVN